MRIQTKIRLLYKNNQPAKSALIEYHTYIGTKAIRSWKMKQLIIYLALITLCHSAVLLYGQQDKENGQDNQFNSEILHSWIEPEEIKNVTIFGIPPPECDRLYSPTHRKITQMTSFQGSFIHLYTNLVNIKTRLPQMSGSHISLTHLQYGRPTRGTPTPCSPPTQSYRPQPWFPIILSDIETTCIAEDQQPYCKSFYHETFRNDDYLKSRKRVRSLLTPTYGHQLNEDTVELLHSCINTAPQDSNVNSPAWYGVEQLAFNHVRLSTGGFVVTGTCGYELEIEYPENPNQPPLHKPVPVPACLWKIVCVKPTQRSEGKARIGGWIGFNGKDYPAKVGNCEDIERNTKTMLTLNQLVMTSNIDLDEIKSLVQSVEGTVGENFASKCFDSDAQSLITLDRDPEVKCSGYDGTRMPMEIGYSVVFAVNQMLINSGIFSQNYQFLFRAAYALRNFGEKLETFQNENLGGIWQISDAFLAQTKQAPANILAEIKTVFNIDWQTVGQVDMLKPLYSGIAAALRFEKFITDNPHSKPMTVKLASELIVSLFTPSSGDSAPQIEQRINDYYKQCPARGAYDLVLVLDGSGSITAPVFNNDVKPLVAELLSKTKHDSGDARLGLILFSSDVQTIFDLNNNLTPHEIAAKALGLSYPNGMTATGDGMIAALNMFQSTGKDGNPLVCIVLTDGNSNQGLNVVTAASQLAAAAPKIVTYSIGIDVTGGSVNVGELSTIANNILSNVFYLSNFRDLIEMPLWLNVRVETAARPIPFGRATIDSVGRGELRYYKISVPIGLTVEVFDIRGKTERYFSHSFSTPTSAVYDGKIEVGLQYIPPLSTRTVQEIYISVGGIEDGGNQYEIIVHEGYHAGCGLRGIRESLIQSPTVALNIGDGYVIWEAQAYGYETRNDAKNAMYVNTDVVDGYIKITTKPRFPRYTLETGLLSMQVPISFNCAGGETKFYTVVIPVAN